jgi:hypothetical protein
MVNANTEPLARSAMVLPGGLGTIIFLRLDYRNSQIVDINEKPLRYLESLTRNRMGFNGAWATFEKSHNARRQSTTYGALIPALYILIWISWFSSAVIFLSRAVDLSASRSATPLSSR